MAEFGVAKETEGGAHMGLTKGNLFGGSFPSLTSFLIGEGVVGYGRVWSVCDSGGG